MSKEEVNYNQTWLCWCCGESVLYFGFHDCNKSK